MTERDALALIHRARGRVDEGPDTRITHTYTPTRRDGQPYKRPRKPVTLVLMVHEQDDYIENAAPADEDDLRLFGLVRAGATPPSADDPAAVEWFAERLHGTTRPLNGCRECLEQARSFLRWLADWPGAKGGAPA